MRFRVRGKLPNGAPIITKVNADTESEAIAKAVAEFSAGGTDLATIRSLAARELKDSKQSSVYIGRAKLDDAGNPIPKAPKAAPAPKATGAKAKHPAKK